MNNGMSCKRGWLSMEINRDGRAGQAMLPGQSEHRLTEGRQGRWLYELEQALLIRSDKKPVAAEPQREAAPEQATMPESGPEVGGGQDAGAASGGMSPVKDGHGPSRSSATVAPAEATSAGAGAGKEAPTDLAAPAPMSTPPAPAPGVGGGLAPALAALAATAQQTVTAMPGLSLAAYAAAGGAGQRTANEAVASGVQPAHESKAVVMAALNWTAAPLGDEAPSPMAESAAPEEDAAPAPASAPRDQEPVDDYASRLMHVYQGADGVQAWVRDASIGATQSLLLARSMADELSSAGNRLAALTVNGKKILSDGDSQPINSKGAV